MTQEKIIGRRFNLNSIDRIAKCRCRNASEKLWQIATMFSEGKRLNLDQIDICKAMVKLSVCLTVNDNIKRTNGELSSLLGIPVTLAKKQFMERKQEK